MATLSVSTNSLFVSSGRKTFHVCIGSNNVKYFEHPKFRNSKIMDGDKREEESCESSATRPITINEGNIGLTFICTDVSNCGQWLVICTLSKHLCLVNVNTMLLTSKRILTRGASKVIFTPKSDRIVVADKSGDVYLFSREDSEDNGVLILGHLSMLLDVLVTPDERYILTCDRDEKIRVSFFPKAYVIYSYCLGHTEFVTTIQLLAHDSNVLISSSGDGTIRFWNYKEGKELVLCDVHERLNSSNNAIDESCQCAVISVTSKSFSGKFSMVCVCINNFKGVLVYNAVTLEERLQCSFVETISLEFAPSTIKFSTINVLWISSASGNPFLEALAFDELNSRFTNVEERISFAVQLINAQDMDIMTVTHIVSLLYKRKLDNVQEYLEKKSSRLSMAEPVQKKIKQ